MVSIHLRLNKELAAQIKLLEKQFGFNSVQEFIRAAIRHAVEEYEKKRIIRELKKLQGSAKPKKNRLSKKEWFKEYLKKNPSEIFREFNL